MVDQDTTEQDPQPETGADASGAETGSGAAARPRRRRAASRPAGPPLPEDAAGSPAPTAEPAVADAADAGEAPAPVKATRKRAPRKTATKKAAAAAAAAGTEAASTDTAGIGTASTPAAGVAGGAEPAHTVPATTPAAPAGVLDATTPTGAATPDAATLESGTPETGTPEIAAPQPAKRTRKTAAKKTAAKKATTPRKTAAKKTAASSTPPAEVPPDEVPPAEVPSVEVPQDEVDLEAEQAAEPTLAAETAVADEAAAAAPTAFPEADANAADDVDATAADDATAVAEEPTGPVQDAGRSTPAVPVVLFQPPADTGAEPPQRRRRTRATRPAQTAQPETGASDAAATPEAAAASAGLAASGQPAAEPAGAADLAAAAADEPEAPRTRPRRRRAVRGQAAPAQEPTDEDDETGAAAVAEPATGATPGTAEPEVAEDTDEAQGAEDGAEGDESDDEGRGRRRRRRGGRGRRSRGRSEGEGSESEGEAGETAEDADVQTSEVEPEAGGAESGEAPEGEGDEDSSSSRRRRRRRRRGGADDTEGTEPEAERPAGRTREPRRRGRSSEDSSDEVQSLRGSTRLEAKKQRRREGRELGRRRTPLLTEAEFLARREAVDRTMVVRQRGKRTQIAVLEDDLLVEHYVDNGDSGSLVGSVFLGRVQNVLPSMEAAFLDLGRGRNAVLYAGEVNWDAVGVEGQPRRIEIALKSGDPVLVQVTKDPIAHKGARLTSQISLPGRFLVYVPGGSMTGISRKLPENERARLKTILRKVVPEDAGVIVRTAAEGASEEDIAADVERLQAQWEQIQKVAKTASAPALLHGEPDLTVRVLRDVFNEDFAKVVVQGDGAWDTVEPYIRSVAPELAQRVSRWTGTGNAFAAHRIDEQLTKALDRKVFLPSGGSLVIDRTEAMVVVDVNTGRFIGKGGNLEETVTKNNLEAAEEIVRQLRLRDLGGIIVVDFIDMVLESNRDLVMRRLLECLGRDRTKHQVAEVTSLGLVQMTRKRVGTGLLEAFSEPCEHCKGRGVRVTLDSYTEPDPAAEQGRRPRPMVTPGAPPSPALLAPLAAPARTAVEGNGKASEPAAAPAQGGDDGRTPVAAVVAEALAADPVAAEDPVSEAPAVDSGPTSSEPVQAEPSTPDPVVEPVDDGRPQRRRRRATRP